MDRTDGEQPNAPAPTRAGPAPVAAWSLLEFALALWGTAVGTVHLPLLVVQDLGGSDAHLGIATAGAVGLIAVVGPLVGGRSDRAHGRIPFFAAALVLCALPTATLGTAGLAWSLAAFVAASVGQGIGLIFVDVLLTAVSGEADRGRIGGLGVAAGLAGSLVGTAIGLLVLGLGGGDRALVFRVAALAVLALGLPALWRLRAIPGAAPAAAGDAARPPAGLAARLRANPGFTRLLVAHFFYGDAAATMIAFMTIYAVREVGFSETQAQFAVLAGVGGGIVGGLTVGAAVDRAGPKRALVAMLWVWLAVFAGVAAIPLLGLPGPLFWGVAPMAGFALGGAWAADRPLLLRLVPAAALGQMVGVYSSVGRAAAVGGPLLWALVVDVLGWGRPAAVLVLAGLTVVALIMVGPISDAPPADAAGPDESPPPLSAPAAA